MTAGRLALWLRWSWRDLRARWLQVAAIAVIVSIGVGVYAGLMSTAAWRRISYDASYARLGVHDVHVVLSRGSYVDPRRLEDAIRRAGDGSAVDGVETRLVVPTQVDASTSKETILVPGRLVGVDVSDGPPSIDGIFAKRGRGLRASDRGHDVAVLDFHFADHYHLRDRGTVRIAGDVPVRYVGQGLSPEYFVVTSDQGTFLAQANFAVMFLPRSTVQRLTGHAGLVNDAVVRIAPGLDRARTAKQIEDAIERSLPDVATEVTPRDDEQVYKYLYEDIKGDQRLYNIFALLILGGAAFAAFNLVGRIVEAQRREIGIGMALGLERRKLALRPMLVGLQVALLGTVLGIGVGLLVGVLVSQLMQSFLPLPVWRTPFRPSTFLRGAALGLGLPFAATLLPVWRAVRVEPIDAIRTGPSVTGRFGLAPLLHRFVRGGSSIREMPFRNVLRAPRRTLLTSLAIAAAIATLLSVIGMVDSFFETIDVGEREILREEPSRLTVGLDGFQLVGSPTIQTIEGSKLVSKAAPGLTIGGTLDPGGDHEFDVLLNLVDFEQAPWVPSTTSGSLVHRRPGIVLSEKAADDLGVSVGDTVTLRHPRREGLTGYRWVVSKLPVLATHPNPYRFVAFMDLRDASLFDLRGVVNTLQVVPARGVSAERIERGLFDVPGVSSVQPVKKYAQTIRDVIDEMLGVLDVVRVAVLLLAALIAFNSSSISADERAREHATMFAFGLPVRSVLRMAVVESAIIGVLGTLAGLVLGLGLLGWIVHALLPTTMPELGIEISVSSTTIATAVGLGIVAVALAPVLTLRRMRRMDIPATLRVVE